MPRRNSPRPLAPRPRGRGVCPKHDRPLLPGLEVGYPYCLGCFCSEHAKPELNRGKPRTPGSAAARPDRHRRPHTAPDIPQADLVSGETYEPDAPGEWEGKTAADREIYRLAREAYEGSAEWETIQRRKRERSTTRKRTKGAPVTLDPTGMPPSDWHKPIPTHARLCRRQEDDGRPCLRPVIARGVVSRIPVCRKHWQREYRRLIAMRQNQSSGPN